MTFYNPHTNEWYYGGALKTADGLITNPTRQVLLANGFEPYAPPAPEPIPASEERRKAYEVECDPLLIASLGYTMEGNDDAAAACRAQYLAKKAEIRERIPDEALTSETTNKE